MKRVRRGSRGDDAVRHSQYGGGRYYRAVARVDVMNVVFYIAVLYILVGFTKCVSYVDVRSLHLKRHYQELYLVLIYIFFSQMHKRNAKSIYGGMRSYDKSTL